MRYSQRVFHLCIVCLCPSVKGEHRGEASVAPGGSRRAQEDTMDVPTMLANALNIDSNFINMALEGF
jgi:hypothetical protein